MALDKLLCILFSLFFSISTFAQKTPMKWGKIAPTDLSMDGYALDPDAEAVVLGDFGKIEFFIESDGEIKYEFKYHKRVKILKESAFDRGDIEISYYGGRNSEKVRGVKAQVFYPDGSKIKLDKKSIFDEKVSDTEKVKKFAIPKLKEGCIFEYQYTKTSEYFVSLENWYFQSDIPVQHSELWVDVPNFFIYVYLLESAGGHIQRNEISNGGESGRLGSHVANRLTYRMTDLAAMKEEPYITTMRNYLASVRFQLQQFNMGATRKEYLSTWEKLAEGFMQNDKFGDRFSKTRRYPALIRAAAPHLNTSGSTLEKIQATQAFISSQVKWNGDYGVYADLTLDDVFAKKIADGGELNMMLLALLKHQNIEAQPILISTRGLGKPIQLYPIRQQFNHLMVYVVVDGKPMVLDAVDEYHPAGYPHKNTLNGYGWIVSKENPKWVKIAAPKSSESYLVSFELNAKGDLSGSINASVKGYDAVYMRKEFEKSPQYGDWKKDIATTYPKIEIDSLVKTNLDDIYKPLKVEVKCRIPGAAQVNGDFIYLSPVINPSFNENPFKLEKRNYPVEISSPIKENYVLNLTIPAGYVIEELPEQVKLTLPNGGGRFQYLVKKVDESHIQLISKLNIKQLYFAPAEYPAVKQLFDLIVEKQGEQIVLKKRS